MSERRPDDAEPTLTIKAFGVTDRGRVRAANEDQFLIAELTKAMRIWQTSVVEPKVQVGEERAHLFLVADGMGGHRAGERASALALAAIEQFTLNTFKWFFGPDGAEAKHALTEFKSALDLADTRIMDEAAEHPELRGMGTTVTMAFHLGTQLCIVHAGDSRAYVHRNGRLHQITQDHTVTADLVRAGTLSADQAAEHPHRHVITNVVGGNDRGVRVEARALQIEAGDRLLLCSDGLTEMVSEEAIGATLDGDLEPEAAATHLLAQANEAGGRDNITVLIVRFDSSDAELLSADLISAADVWAAPGERRVSVSAGEVPPHPLAPSPSRDAAILLRSPAVPAARVASPRPRGDRVSGPRRLCPELFVERA